MDREIGSHFTLLYSSRGQLTNYRDLGTWENVFLQRMELLIKYQRILFRVVLSTFEDIKKNVFISKLSSHGVSETGPQVVTYSKLFPLEYYLAFKED